MCFVSLQALASVAVKTSVALATQETFAWVKDSIDPFLHRSFAANNAESSLSKFEKFRGRQACRVRALPGRPGPASGLAGTRASPTRAEPSEQSSSRRRQTCSAGKLLLLFIRRAAESYPAGPQGHMHRDCSFPAWCHGFGKVGGWRNE